MEDLTRPEEKMEMPSYAQPTLPAEHTEVKVAQEVVQEPELEPEAPFVSRDFTIEQMAFIRSLQEPNTQSRMGVIQTIQWYMARTEDPETRKMMEDTQNLLGAMDDKEYNEYDFSVDLDEPKLYPN